MAIIIGIWSGNWRTGWQTGVVLLTTIPVVVGGAEVEVDALVDEEVGASEVDLGVGGAFVGRGFCSGGDLLTSVSPMKAKTPLSPWSSSMLAIKDAT